MSQPCIQVLFVDSIFTLLFQTSPCWFSHLVWRGGEKLCSTRGWRLSKHSLKLLVLKSSISCVCQIKLQHFFWVRRAILVAAVFWLQWLTHKSLWPLGLAGCSLTLSWHNPFFLFLLFFGLLYDHIFFSGPVKRKYLNFSLASEKLSETK